MRRLALLLLAAACGLSACDTGSILDENVVLTKTRTVTFSYACNARASGQSLSVNATTTIDFTGQLDGFRAADVVSARVTDVRLRRLLPTTTPEKLGELMRDLRLVLVGSGGGTVVDAATLPAATSVTLTPMSTDLAALVRAGAFQPRLDFTVVGTQNTECKMDAEMTFRIELPGV